MEGLLRALSLLLLVCGAGSAAFAQRDDTHRLRLDFDFDAVGASSQLAAWPSGGLGKLRFDELDDDIATGNRISLDYSGRLRSTLWAHIVADYVDDASPGLDLTEAYLLWRPVPKSANQHQLRIGAFYPPLSFENSGSAWTSPYTISFSAINTWLGEEIRPIGLEWTLRRGIGGPGSPHRFAAFASAFYGNDPAATLLFWRGWSLHDRQTRLDDKLAIPALPEFGPNGPSGFIAQTVEPVEEIDSRPGVYLGTEWTLGRRVKLQLALYDNRADPNDFSEGQWGWDTRFSTLAFQASLPGEIGLIVQTMDGRTDWIPGARPDGTIGNFSSVVRDHFDSSFLLLTRVLRGEHRVSVRWDEFAIDRSVPRPLRADDGNAQTVAYRYDGLERMTIALEWLRIRSHRDLWARFYGIPPTADERQLRLQIRLHLDL